MFVYSVNLHPDKDAEGVQPHNEGLSKIMGDVGWQQGCGPSQGD